MWTKSDPFGEWHYVIKTTRAFPRRSSPAFSTACGLSFLIPPKPELGEEDRPCSECADHEDARKNLQETMERLTATAHNEAEAELSVLDEPEATDA